MNYLTIEKNLKRFLKMKIKITAGTVVAFLITGMISYAEELIINDSSANEKGTAIVDKIEENQERVRISTSKGKLKKVIIQNMEVQKNSTANTLDKHFDIISTENVDLENNANLTLVSSELLGKESDESIIHGIFNDGKTHSIINNGTLIGKNNANNSRINDGIKVENNNSTVDITNSGNIKGVIYTAGIHASGIGEFNIINEGEIGGSDSEVARGIQVDTSNTQESSKIKIHNKGKIEVGSRDLDNPQGIVINSYNDDIDIINSGEIKLSSTKNHNTYPNGISIYIKGNGTENIGKVYKVTNKKNALIDTIGSGIYVGSQKNNSVGGEAIILNDGDIKARLNGISVDFIESANIINNGKVEMNINPEHSKESRGIYLNNVKEFSVINNGEIILNKAESGKGIEVTNMLEYEKGIVDNRGTIDLKDSIKSTGIYLNGKKTIAENNGLIALTLNGDNRAVKNINGSFINNGKIQLTDKTSEELKDFDLSRIFEGEYVHNGMIVDKTGKTIIGKDDIIVGGNLTTNQINEMKSENKPINVEEGAVITAGSDLNVGALNIIGNVSVKNNNDSGIKFDSTTVNLDSNGALVIGENSNKADLTLVNGSVNGSLVNTNTKNLPKEDITFGDSNSTLNLDGTTFNNTVIGANGIVNVTNGEFINSIIKSKLNIGNDNKVNEKNNITKVDLQTKFEEEIKINKNGQIVLEVGKEGENALKNSNTSVIGDNIDGNGDIALDLSHVTGKGETISLGEKGKFKDVDITTTSGNNGVYIVEDKDLDKTGNVIIEYNNNLYKDNDKINDINNQAYDVNDYFSQNVEERERELDTIYSANIYSQTVKATYDNYKLSENTILGMGRIAKTGEWNAMGTYLYTDKSFDRKGTVGEYNTDVESYGLLANIEYGLNEKSSFGVIFSGTKQDIDTVGGKTDGDLFYLGAYNRTNIGNGINFIYGAGYQLGKYDSDNNAVKTVTSASYDTNTYGIFAQIKKNIELDDSLMVVPKLKLGYTYVDQDDVEDSYFAVENASVSTVDTNLGIELLKVIPMENGNFTFTTGIDYTKIFGDTDKEFRGSFSEKKVGRNYFDVLGAELSEDNLRFTLMGEMEQNNGVFYNLGLSYTIGENDAEETNVQVGIGYKF